MTDAIRNAPRTTVAPIAIAALALALAGCSMSGGQPKGGTVRSSGETAPADLQLLCASEAASRFNISGGVLPVSSMPGPGGTYQVNLTMDAGQAVCFIDQSGAVQSLEMI
jgi:hypothetical protein